ncbi:hypothetical protein [Clostridium omnivorum]|uniref:Lipoprotein n=1 Tax=Clostridium omnivorum TaxID=1604902 RepID=A0ABQ5N736_9CLOT|nr:hypothetical protein [Clostridium sp. E14]GLC31007.1 lipoprotein [Clostridium sp. E14]
MKKKSWIVFIPVFFMLFLQGCKQIDADVEGKIAAPKVNTLYLNGSYNIESYKSVKDSEKEIKELRNYIGKKVFISEESAIFGDEVREDPQYKVKNVSARDFFLNKYKTSPNVLGISADKIEIISITSNDQLFYDFIRIDDKNLIVHIDAGFLYLKKYSNVVDSKDINKSELKSEVSLSNAANKEDKLLRSGVLIGLRSDDAANNGLPSYRTLWIASSNRELKPVLEMPQLFVPRTTGFWEVGSEQKSLGGKSITSIYAKSVINLTKGESLVKTNELPLVNGIRSILFVGNDYIGTEFNIKDKKIDKLQVLPVDNIKSGKGINISDVVSGNAKELLLRSSEVYLLSQSKDKVEKLEKEPKMDNFTLIRKNGHWAMVGRLNYSKPEENSIYDEFSINIATPAKLISYDELCVPWNQIKTRLPEAIDAYTSPNKDIAILYAQNYIYIYSIQSGVLSDKPLRKLKIQEGEKVIMAEWAIGEYSEKWDETVKNRAVKFRDE